MKIAVQCEKVESTLLWMNNFQLYETFVFNHFRSLGTQFWIGTQYPRTLHKSNSLQVMDKMNAFEKKKVEARLFRPSATKSGRPF